MAPFSTSLVAFFLVAPLLALAAPSPAFTYPSQIAGLPRDATHLALDEERREIIAFRRDEQLGRFAWPDTTDGVTRRATGACSDMSSDDVQKCELP
jgi:hypothetical protein